MVDAQLHADAGHTGAVAAMMALVMGASEILSAQRQPAGIVIGERLNRSQNRTQREPNIPKEHGISRNTVKR